MRMFLSGDEACAEGVRLARPQVISAYPITPQTVVVERLSEMVEAGSLRAEYVHVESEHSALSCAIGAAATGARTFTATSSQGLLYMAECLTYASGGRFPIVMMNATRATALPWSIYGDQRDALSLLDHGWIQAFAQDAQEALDLALMAYAVAEDPTVRTPFMVNLDGFTITHTYEPLDVPSQQAADAFLPPYDATGNRFDFEHPVNMGYSAGPAFNAFYKYQEHRAMAEAVPAGGGACGGAVRRAVRASLPGLGRVLPYRRCRLRGGHAGCNGRRGALRGGRAARRRRTGRYGAHPLHAAVSVEGHRGGLGFGEGRGGAGAGRVLRHRRRGVL